MLQTQNYSATRHNDNMITDFTQNGYRDDQPIPAAIHSVRILWYDNEINPSLTLLTAMVEVPVGRRIVVINPLDSLS